MDEPNYPPTVSPSVTVPPTHDTALTGSDPTAPFSLFGTLLLLGVLALAVARKRARMFEGGTE